MSNIGVRGEQSTSTEISALTSLTSLAKSGSLQFLYKTGQATFANGTLVAGSNITITDGGNGSYTISSTASGGGGSSISLQTGGVLNASQSVLNLIAGTGMTLTANGVGGVTFASTNTGTVTSVSVTTANGVSGSVANATTTPAITLTLGAITPTSVNGLTISTTTGTLTVTNGKTLSVSNSMTLAAGADGQTFTFPAASDTVAGLGTAQTFTAAQTNTASYVFTSAATNGTTFYNTADQVTNFEKVTHIWLGNNYEIGSYSGGTGTVRSIRIGTGSSSGSTTLARYLMIGGGPRFSFNDSTGTAQFLMGTSFTTTSSSGSTGILNLAATVNESSTAAFTGLLINPTITTTGTGTKLLQDWQIGGTSQASFNMVGSSSSTNPIVSATSAVHNAFNFPALTYNISGNTAITTAAGVNKFVVDIPTYASDTATCAITTASTFTIIGAPVAGTNVTIGTALSFWVQGGPSRFNGRIGINNTPGAATDLGITGTKTIASAASATYNSIQSNGVTITLSGSTNITTATGFNSVQFLAPTYSAASALTITNAATVYIDNAPQAAGAGPATITNAYSLWIAAGNARFDGHLVVEGVTSTGATGTGKFVFDTSPTIQTSLVAGTASFDLVNTTATTVNFAGAATTMAIGASTALITVPGNIISTNNAITASGNAATVPITHRLSTVTNNSAATLTITLTTTSAVDGQMLMVRVLDFSAVAQTITWVNTEDSTVTAPTTSNGSTSLPLTVGFQYNASTSKWRCIAKA